jgi:hypothetical protein
LNDAGGGWRSRRMRLWDGLREERRVAVARPIPEEAPVIKIVLEVDFNVARDSIVGWKRDMVKWFC